MAQDAQSTKDEANLDTIVVTGSLIRNPNLVSAAPISVIGAEEIQFRQSTNAEELLRDLPGIVPSVGSAVNNGNGGASFVNLRGLGSFRNIVLLNNTRLVPAGLGGQVDLNNIPVS
ncbi:TonB-dependent receptor plug domain-containing protein [Hankyongella ginsenosidimutans]|uniref:TonB-dependent receptor plug domain-containing protein n=1 Tax=Hankyongella ginsenosidimutans TaxID=1763828 RepID=UPI001FEA4FD4|nr:TonB-dependent receptor plug domain-containing protein [Hankyongella ginsenosidimutans]